MTDQSDTEVKTVVQETPTSKTVAFVEQPKVEEPKVEEPKVEEPKKQPTPEQIEKKRGRSDGKPKGGSPAQQAKRVQESAESKQAGAPGSLTKAQQAAVNASLGTEPKAIRNEGQQKNRDLTLKDGTVVQVAAFNGLPLPKHSMTIALTGRSVVKRTNPAARWAAFMTWYNDTPAAERTVESFVLYSQNVAAGKSKSHEKKAAPTMADLQWAAGKGWLVFV